jgi:DNA invertase Pin-like site-specific DNA recombinase
MDRDGKSGSPERQALDCKNAAIGRGWRVAWVYSDRDTSAYTRTVRRPEYERLLRDLSDGASTPSSCGSSTDWCGFTAIGEVLRVLEETGAELVSVMEPWLDTTSPMG